MPETVILFSVWSMNGDSLSTLAQDELEQAIERAIKNVEQKEKTRLLYTKVAE